ncbi:MAG: hypothetical protein ACOC5K_00385 [Chloroflexota bacterium]
MTKLTWTVVAGAAGYVGGRAWLESRLDAAYDHGWRDAEQRFAPQLELERERRRQAEAELDSPGSRSSTR